MSRHIRCGASVAILAVSLALLSMAPAAQALVGTSTILSSSAQPSVYGQPVTFTATVTAPGTVPTGHVSFAIGALPPVDVTLDGNAQARYTATPSALGSHQVVATYNGNLDSSSAKFDQVVDIADADGAIVASPNIPVAGQAITLDATFSGHSPSTAHPSSGTVQFSYGAATPLGSPKALQPDGRAQAQVAADAGDYTVRAAFSGEANFRPATAARQVHVNRADTATTVISAPNPATVGGDLTVTVDVAVLAPGNVDLDGAVQMTVNGQPLGAPIDVTGFTGLIATVKAPTTPQTGTIGAQYLGGPNTNPSSGSLQQTIEAVAAAASSAALPPAVAAAASSGAPPPAVAPAIGTSQRLLTMTSALRASMLARGLGAIAGVTERFTAPSAGKLEQQIFTPSAPRTALAASVRPVPIATAVRTFAAAGAATVKFKLTAAGRRAIHRARSLKLSVVTRFTPRAGAATRRVDRFTVKAKPGHSAGAGLPRLHDYRQRPAVRFAPSALTIAAWRIP